MIAMSKAIIFALLTSNAAAFVPQQKRSFVILSKNGQQQLHRLPTPSQLFMAEVDDEVEEEVRTTMEKTARMSNLRSPKGVEYAPWMKMSEEDEAQVRQIAKEKAEARKRRQEQERDLKGALLQDSQGQELSGVGLRGKVIDGSSVELEWATSSEASTRGFIIKRRQAKTEDFEVIASYETYGPLETQGVDGGIYRYMDKDLSPGGWVYRVTECESSGQENDLSQCLVEITTAEEQRGAVLALGALGVVAIVAIVAGSLLDPIQ